MISDPVQLEALIVLAGGLIIVMAFVGAAGVEMIKQILAQFTQYKLLPATSNLLSALIAGGATAYALIAMGNPAYLSLLAALVACFGPKVVYDRYQTVVLNANTERYFKTIREAEPTEDEPE